MQPWGDYFGRLTDRFGAQWMFNCATRVEYELLASDAQAEFKQMRTETLVSIRMILRLSHEYVCHLQRRAWRGPITGADRSCTHEKDV